MGRPVVRQEIRLLRTRPCMYARSPVQIPTALIVDTLVGMGAADDYRDSIASYVLANFGSFGVHVYT